LIYDTWIERVSYIDWLVLCDEMRKLLKIEILNV